MIDITNCPEDQSPILHTNNVDESNSLIIGFWDREGGLVPIYELIADKDKRDAMEKAIYDYLNN